MLRRMDIGAYRYPVHGNSRVAIWNDAVSGEAFGDGISSEFGLGVRRVCVSQCKEKIEEVTYDLSDFARGAEFVNLMARFGVATV